MSKVKTVSVKVDIPLKDILMQIAGEMQVKERRRKSVNDAILALLKEARPDLWNEYQKKVSN